MSREMEHSPSRRLRLELRLAGLVSGQAHDRGCLCAPIFVMKHTVFHFKPDRLLFIPHKSEFDSTAFAILRALLDTLQKNLHIVFINKILPLLVAKK